MHPDDDAADARPMLVRLLAWCRRPFYRLARWAAGRTGLRSWVLQMSSRHPRSIGRAADFYRVRRARELGVVYLPPTRQIIKATRRQAIRLDMPTRLAEPEAIAYRRIAAAMCAGSSTA